MCMFTLPTRLAIYISDKNDTKQEIMFNVKKCFIAYNLI